jgi:hypothetical protein
VAFERTVEMLDDERVGAANADATHLAGRIWFQGAYEVVAEREVMEREEPVESREGSLVKKEAVTACGADAPEIGAGAVRNADAPMNDETAFGLGCGMTLGSSSYAGCRGRE